VTAQQLRPHAYISEALKALSLCHGRDGYVAAQAHGLGFPRVARKGARAWMEALETFGRCLVADLVVLARRLAIGPLCAYLRALQPRCMGAVASHGAQDARAPVKRVPSPRQPGNCTPLLSYRNAPTLLTRSPPLLCSPVLRQGHGAGVPQLRVFRRSFGDHIQPARPRFLLRLVRACAFSAHPQS